MSCLYLLCIGRGWVDQRYLIHAVSMPGTFLFRIGLVQYSAVCTSTYLVHSSGSHLVFQYYKRGISSILILSPFAESSLRLVKSVSHDLMWCHDPIYHNQRLTIRIILPLAQHTVWIILSLVQHTGPDLLHDISHIHLRPLYQMIRNMCTV